MTDEAMKRVREIAANSPLGTIELNTDMRVSSLQNYAENCILAALSDETIRREIGGEWLPIESYPKDHFARLVYTEYGAMVAFLDVTWEWWPFPASEKLPCKPTHWMPLPPRPKEKA